MLSIRRWLGVVLFTAVVGLAGAFQSPPMAKVSGTAPAVAHVGGAFSVTVTIDVPAGFHVYAPSYKGETGIPIQISEKGAPAGVKIGKVQAPKGDVLMGKAQLKVPVKLPSGLRGKVSFQLKVRYQQCNDRVCLPPQNAMIPVTVTAG